ncbi:hypothetical protein GH741_19865 [Aquibacillus halophilus]|uniref:Uncharacterized protein n=1 Tax=Aquibacillus halophilus TaxID=930132 RepID=A0A6A8DGV8_9BACI|nr:hypothetical protein [Aquibacillus halophilus]MRH44903.1 hypothetical protein [Aquibacillus halophilus]
MMDYDGRRIIVEKLAMIIMNAYEPWVTYAYSSSLIMRRRIGISLFVSKNSTYINLNDGS